MEYTSAPFTRLHGIQKDKFAFMGTYYLMVRKLVNKNIVGIGRELMQEIYRYFPAGTTEIYAETSAGAQIYRHR